MHSAKCIHWKSARTFMLITSEQWKRVRGKKKNNYINTQ